MNILEKIIKKEIEKAFLILEKKKIIYDDFNQNNDPNKSLDLSQSNTSNNDFTKMEDLESNLPNETINSNDNLPDSSNLNGGMSANSYNPSANNNDLGLDNDPNQKSSPNLEDESEENKDPIQSTFDKLKEISNKSENVTDIIKAIKGSIQTKFSNQNIDTLMTLYSKIKTEGTPIMKKALERQEINSLFAGGHNEN
jgi:hypothetical protein